MHLKVKYTPVLVNRPEKVRDFLVDMLGFSFCQQTTLVDGQEGIIVGENDTAESCFLLLKGTEAQKTCPSPIIINTEDCLRDCHDLQNRGINIIKKPEYTDLGLTAEIADADGNRYTLLEERIYSENL
jgi:predicted enzyme related to lactoylglutathione lyase